MTFYRIYQDAPRRWVLEWSATGWYERSGYECFYTLRGAALRMSEFINGDHEVAP